MQKHYRLNKTLGFFLSIVLAFYLTSPSYGAGKNSKTKVAKVATPLQVTDIKPHTAIYTLSLGGFDVGHIRYQLIALNDGKMRYTIDSDLGFLLLSDRRQIISEFTIDPKNFILTPLLFSQVRKGTGADFEETINFDHKKKQATAKYKNKTESFPFKAITFDPLNAQIQMRLDFLAGKKLFHYPYISANKLDNVSFSLLGEETVKFDNHNMLTTKAEIKRKSKKRNTYIWFSKKLGYIPYKIEDSRQGKEAIIAQLIYYEQNSSKGRIIYDKIIYGKPVDVRTIYDKPKKKKRNKHLRK